MNDFLRIEHLLSVKRSFEDVEINFSFSNMQFLLRPEELPFTKESIRLYGPPGDARLTCGKMIEALSRREQVPSQNIFLALGSSMANFVMMSILINRGDRVLIEHPVYEPLLKVPQFLGADVHFMKRDPNDFVLKPEEIEKHCTKDTRLIILTDSHNPSGNQLSAETLNYLKKLNQENQTQVLIDEVFGKFYRARSLFLNYPEFIVTSSLSKYYGLGSLRGGWAFAKSALVEKARDFIDYVSPELPYCSFYLAAELLESPLMEELEKRIQKRVQENREIVIGFLNSCNHLTTYIPRNGTLFFPQLKKEIDLKKFHKVLEEKYKTVVTPGTLFGLPRFFRISAIYNAETMREGLKRIDLALQESYR